MKEGEGEIPVSYCLLINNSLSITEAPAGYPNENSTLTKIESTWGTMRREKKGT